MVETGQDLELWPTRLAMLRSRALVLATLCCLTAACRPTQVQSTNTRAVQEPNIVWVQLRGANVLVPNKDQEEWNIRETVIWQRLLELAAWKPKRALECHLRIYKTPEEECSNYGDEAATSGRPYDALAIQPPPPPPNEPIRLQPSAAFLQRFASHHSMIIKSISGGEEVSFLAATDSVLDENQAIIDVGDILWIGRNQVEVSSNGGTYYLWKLGGIWQVFGWEDGICACE